jgi:hypothetical protein
MSYGRYHKHHKRLRKEESIFMVHHENIILEVSLRKKDIILTPKRNKRRQKNSSMEFQKYQNLEKLGVQLKKRMWKTK